MNVSDRINRLRAESPDCLRSLPQKREEHDIEIEGKRCSLITWHDEPSPGNHRIVLAVYFPAMMGLAKRVTADGFMLASD